MSGRSASSPISRRSDSIGTARWCASRIASTSTGPRSARLTDAGLTYRCWCSRREVAEAAAAPHDGLPRYPGTCRDLSDVDVSERVASGRPAAVRLRADHAEITFDDAVHGSVSGRPDDVVLERNDGVPAYQLAVVVDDGEQGIDQVVRGDDLLDSTPSQIHLSTLLGIDVPSYAHVPLVLGPDGQRLAKRHGAVTLAEQSGIGTNAAAVRGLLATGLGIGGLGGLGDGELDDLLDAFDPTALSTSPWTYTDDPAR